MRLDLAILQQKLETAIPLFSSKAKPSATTGAVQKVRGRSSVPGPMFPSVPGTSTSTGAQPSVSSISSSMSTQAGPSHVSTPPRSPSGSHETPAKRRRRRCHICHVCGFEKTKKSDLDDHLAKEHQIGTPRKCRFCGKMLATKRGLKDNEQKQHGQKLKNDKCPLCPFSTDGKELLDIHMVRHHNYPRMKYFACPRFDEKFDATNLVKKHMKKGMCQVMKNSECDQCDPVRRFKTRTGLEMYLKVYHMG